jgi:hypothetical protein
LKTIKKTKAIAGLTPRGETDLRRFSVYPSRAVMDLSLSINDIRTLLALGLYTSGSGVAFPTLQTIGAYTGQGTAGNQAALRRLIDKGYIRKLQPKWYAGQSSPWLTDRYQVLYSKDDPVPTKEQLQESKAFNIHSLEPQGTNSKEELPSNQEHTVRVQGIENCFRSILNTYGVTVTQSQFLPASSLVSSGISLALFKDQASLAIAQWLRSKGSVPSGLQQLIDAGSFSPATPSPPPRPL